MRNWVGVKPSAHTTRGGSSIAVSPHAIRISGCARTTWFWHEDTLGNCPSGKASYQFWLNVRKTAYSLFRDEQVSCGGACVAKQCD